MEKKLVLVEGSHSHALLLNDWGQKPLLTLALTLTSDVKETPYSGMLPGQVAGFYSHRENPIDLLPLVRFAGAVFIHRRSPQTLTLPDRYLSLIDAGNHKARVL